MPKKKKMSNCRLFQRVYTPEKDDDYRKDDDYPIIL